MNSLGSKADQPSAPAAPQKAAGAALSGAKQQALHTARRKKRQNYEAALAALPVPKPFTGLLDFLATLRKLIEALPHGAQGALARACGASPSTVSKWFVQPAPKRLPGAANLAKAVAWWRANHDREGEVRGHRDPARKPAATSALKRLSPDIQQRLEKTARLRRLTPIQYAGQILDRALPKRHELE